MLYPFPPWEWHGGTLRLHTAARALADDALDIRYWDPAARAWKEVSPDIIGNGTCADIAEPRGSVFGLKRNWLPSTLFESGRHAVAAAEMLLAGMRLDDQDTVILHTTYLAPLIPTVRRTRARAVVDVYDLVWRAHRIDAIDAPISKWAVRAAYAAAVRAREMPLLARADRLLAAGYRDFELIRDLGPGSAWVPTGLECEITAGPPTPPVRIGLIGNFAHGPTIDAAERLLASNIGRSSTDAVQIVFAGLGSLGWQRDPRVEVLGPVSSINDFYRRVTAVLVPVQSGSGMKCKLAEAALAGKAVITTPAGASGYPPDLRREFYIFHDPTRLDDSAIVKLAEQHHPLRASHRFAAAVGLRAAAEAYSAAVS